jgi:imidazolonepropionase-like amidohydrolase
MEVSMETQNPQLKVVKGSSLIDGRGGGVLQNAVVVIDGSRIKEIGTEGEVKVPSEAEVIELANCTLMPGLIDIHVHLAGHNVLTFENYRVAQVEVSPQLQMLYTLLHGQILFEMGFTTLRDHPYPTAHSGHNTGELVAIRDAINAGIFAGPRLMVGGFALITGAHIDRVFPGHFRREPGYTADGPWELRKVVRTHLRTGVDFIKTCASGGGGTPGAPADIRNMTQEEIDAIVDEAHAFKKQCACHCFTPESEKMAVRAGVDTIEHTVFTDEEAIEMMKAENKVIVPTLYHRSDRAIEARRQTGAPEFVVNKLKSVQPYAWETFKRVHQAGIKIAMGTDLEVDVEVGTNAYELELYVDHGMTPMEAIQTATKNAAEAIWLDQDTGTLEAGKCADMIAVEGDPLEDIRVLQDRKRIKIVMKEGKVFVDRRAGHEKFVVHDQEHGWKRFS